MGKKAKGQGGRFIPGSGIARYREWRGLRDTWYDYTQWMRIIGVMAKFITISPVRIVRGLLEYRWFGSYLAAFNMADKCVEGLRGPALRVTREQLFPFMSNATTQLGQMMKGDRRFGDNDFAAKLVMLEQTMPPEILAGFPNLIPMPLEVYQGLYRLLHGSAALPALYRRDGAGRPAVRFLPPLQQRGRRRPVRRFPEGRRMRHCK